jgi:uncharacterized protein (TIGR02284 family)
MDERDREACDALNDLIRLDHAAIEAYRAALSQADDARLRARLRDFLHEHERHTRRLGEQVRRMGGTPADAAGMMRLFTEGSGLLGAFLEDRGVIEAMAQNEAVSNRAYDAALRKLGTHPAAAVVAGQREDERRHKAWLDQQVEAHADALNPGARDAARQPGAHAPRRDPR